MSDEKSQQQTSTESTVAGAAKTGKAISNIAKGAAAGGAHGAAIEAGKSSAKWLIPLIAAVLLPLILVAMLPSIIFGSLLGDGTDTPNGISSDEVLVQNMTAINESISSILSKGLTDVLERIDSDFASSGCDGKEINNPFGADVVFNANAFVSQYCAHKDTDIASISKEDMESLLTANKDKLYQNLNGQQLAIKTYTLLPDQDPADLYEEDFEHDGFLYSMSDIIKEEQHFQEENLHTEVVTVTTASKNLEDILAELKPTIEFDDGISSGTLSLDHSTIKTEAAGYKSSSYTVTATKNYTGLDRNDSSYIDKTVEKNGRTLSLSNVTWSVERTALVGDELVPATYSAVATYSGTASSTVATGYITTAEYKGTVVSSGISSILYTVTYLGTEIVPVEEEPTFNGSIVVIPVIGGTILLATLLLLGLLLRKNTTVYKATGKGNEYEKCGRLRLKTKDPELRIDRLKDIPEGMIAVEVDQAVAKKLFGQTIAIHCYDNTVEHTVGTVNGQYWFKVDIGTQEGEPDTEEEPV